MSDLIYYEGRIETILPAYDSTIMNTILERAINMDNIDITLFERCSEFLYVCGCCDRCDGVLKREYLRYGRQQICMGCYYLLNYLRGNYDIVPIAKSLITGVKYRACMIRNAPDILFFDSMTLAPLNYSGMNDILLMGACLHSAGEFNNELLYEYYFRVYINISCIMYYDVVAQIIPRMI